MKIVAKFLGKVKEFNQPPARSYVTLTNMDTSEEIDTDAASQMLLDAGVDRDGCEFEVLIREEDGKHTASTYKLEPRSLSEEEIKSLSDELEASSKLTPNTPPSYDI